MKTVLVFTFSLLLFCSSIAKAEETWTITSLEWQPYSGSKLPGDGEAIQKLRELLKTENIQLKVEFHPWERAKLLAKNKKYFGYFPAWPEEVEKGFISSTAIDISTISLIKLKSQAIDYKKTEDLFKKYRFGIVETYDYPEELKRQFKTFPKKLNLAPDETSLLKMLEAKRFDFAITDPKVIYFQQAKQKTSELEVIEECLQQKLVLAVNDTPENRERLKRLNQIIHSKLKSNRKTK